jgi:hypothetical protein
MHDPTFQSDVMERITYKIYVIQFIWIIIIIIVLGL